MCSLTCVYAGILRRLRALPAASLLVLLPLSARAQQETLVGGDVSYGGFGGPTLAVSSVSGETALFVGGRGGAVFNLREDHTLILGAGGAGLVTDVAADGVLRDGNQLYLGLGYGGIELEYVNHTNSLLHLTLKTLVGAGGVTYRSKRFDDFDPGSEEDDAFFVVEPALAIELNITTFFRVAAGAGYRVVDGIDLEGVTDEDLTGLGGTLALKFGKF